jgi:Protein of unknown function (DUF4231)
MTLPSVEDQFTEKVRAEIRTLSAYYGRQLRRYRITRLVVIGSAALVPVLAAAPTVPRWTLGLFGAVAFVAEAIQHLFQFKVSSLHALKIRNELERELNQYLMGIGRYVVDPTVGDSQFFERIEAIRAEADKTTLEIWRQASGPTGDQKPALSRH